MNHQLTTFMIGTVIANSLSAQSPFGSERVTNWLGAYKECFGPNTSASWLLDMDFDSLELYVTTDHALVLVDHALFGVAQNGGAYLKQGLIGLGGTRLALMGDVTYVNDTVMRGDYEGQLGGRAVYVSQFVQERNGVPCAVVNVISPKHGSAPLLGDGQELALSFLKEPTEVMPLAPVRAVARR